MEELVLDIMREAVVVMMKVSAPMLLVALIIGLVVSIFQTATSIQEQTLAFIPKIVGVFIALVVFGSWMLAILTTFMTEIFSNFNQFL